MIRTAPVTALAFAALLGVQGAFAPASAVQATGPAIALAPHHAVYKLSLSKSKGTNAPASASGVIDYDFSGSPCEGYATSFRQLTELQPAEGDGRLNDLHSTTFEDGPATQYTFKTVTTTDSETVNDLDGRAIKKDGGAIAVALRKPSGEAQFGPEILFPTEHLRKVIETARGGGHILSASVYDGSDTGRKVYRTLSVIGAPIGGRPGDSAGRLDALGDVPRWPVAISYFEGGAEDRPDYILSFELYENGISRALKLDYGDFVLSGELSELSLGTARACATP